jgi:hypothetical protein
MIDELPNQLLPSDPKVYAKFVLSVESIRFVVMRAQYQEPGNYVSSGPPTLTPDLANEPNQVEIIHRALAACSDDVPPRHSDEQAFIKDPDFRKTLLIELEATRSALIHGVTYDGEQVWFAAGDTLNAFDPTSGKMLGSIRCRYACRDGLRRPAPVSTH